MSNKQKHSESGRSKSQRKQHDQREKQYEQTTGMQWQKNKVVLYGMVALVVVAVIGLTGMFMAGMIKW